MNKELIKNCFDDSAETYDSVADIQRLSSKKLVEMIDNQNIFSVIDIGCGTGNTSLELYQKYPNADYSFCDISSNMLEITKKKFPKKCETMCADAENFMFPEKYDLAISNLSMQWFDDQIAFIKKMKNHCKTFAFSTLLNTSFERYANLFETPPKFNYPSIAELNFIKNYQVQRYSLEFENFFAVARYFKKLGAHAKIKTRLKKNCEKIFLDYDIFFAVMNF